MGGASDNLVEPIKATTGTAVRIVADTRVWGLIALR